MPRSSVPLAGKRVLVTRPAPENQAFAKALRTAGAEPVLAPVIELQRPDDPAAAEVTAQTAAQHAWIVFTSASGVGRFFDLLDARREDACALGNAKVAAIGAKTAQALRAHNVYADLVPQTYVAEDLANALIAASEPGQKILIYAAQGARDVLADRLRAQSREPHVVAAYKTVVVRDPQFAEKVAQSDILTFTSASTVQGFVANFASHSDALSAAQGKLIACIGPITAQTARDLDLHVDMTAHDYTAEGLIAALERYPG